MTLPMEQQGGSGDSLSEDSPKVFHALGRFLTAAELTVVSADYARAAALGGNREPYAQREDGVTFNPRMARLISILIHDLGIRDVTTIRATIYGALVFLGVSPEQFECLGEASLRLSPQVALVLSDLYEGQGQNLTASLVKGIIALDDTRHLHQSALTCAERESHLSIAEQIADALALCGTPVVLITKLQHALVLQRRRCREDFSEGA